jgi:hypothetical protein
MRVSFDFDDTLEMESVQKYAAELVARGIEVWIVTSRFDLENYIKTYFTTLHSGELANKDLHDLAAKIGISEDHIHFTNMMNKWLYFKDNDFVWHLDNDWGECRLIDRKTKTRGIAYFYSPNWKSKCDKELNKYIKRQIHNPANDLSNP